MTTKNRKINGAGKFYIHPIAVLGRTSLAAKLCLQANGLLKQVDDKEIDIRTAKGGLTTLTDLAVNCSKMISPSQHVEIMKSFGAAWDSFYSAKHLDQLMHEKAGDTPYARLIAAFQGDATVSSATQDFILAAASLDKKHGWHAGMSHGQ